MSKVIRKEYVSCNLCGSSENRLILNAKDRLHGTEGLFSYVKCNNCNLVYMNPQVIPDDIGNFYPDDYSPHKIKSIETQQNLKKLKKKFERHYFASNYLSKLNQNSYLLDVGCGNGKFLNLVNKLYGCKVYGVDISKKAAESAKSNYGVNVFVGTITETTFTNNYFDIITAWQYLEHVHNPLQTLRKLHQLLKTDGICIISTPNINSITAKIFKNKWFNLECPRHLYLYTPQTIRSLFDKAGLEVTKIIHDNSSKNLINSLQYYLYGNNYNIKYHNKVKRALIAKWLLSPTTRVFALLKKADNIIISARKIH